MLARFRAMRFLDLAPDAIRQPSLPGQTILGDRGENLSSVLHALAADSGRKAALLQWVQALTPLDVVDFEFPRDFEGKMLVHLIEQGGHKISAYSASDGTLRFLAMAAALLSPDSGRFYFFEELDNGLHPTRLHLLMDLLQRAAGKEDDVQVVATTHNPMLLAFLNQDMREHASLVYRREGKPDSRIARIIDLPDVQRVLQTQDLSRLHASGWLEDAVEFTAAQDEGEDEDPDDLEDDEEQAAS